MQIPKYIEIKNTAGKKAALLSPQADGLKEVWPDCRVNGESSLEFMLPANNKKIAELVPECRIIAGGREYTILKDDAIETIMDEKGATWSKFIAVETWYLLDRSFAIPHIDNSGALSPSDLSITIVGGGTDLSGGLYAVGSAAHALYALLNGTGWSIGTVDVSGVYDLETEKLSILSNLKQVQEKWGGLLFFDSLNKTVSLRDEETYIPYTGFQIRYAKNMKSITVNQNNEIITKMYGFGSDNLDFASINSGVKFLENHDYTAEVYVGIYQNQEIQLQGELLVKTQRVLDVMSRPRKNYKTKLLDLRTLPEYSHEEFSVGDMIDVIHSELGINERTRLIRHKYNLFQPWNCELEFGDFEERFLEKLKASFNTSGYVGDVTTKNPHIKDMMSGILIQSWGDSVADNVDSTHKLKLKFYIPDETVEIKQVKLNFSLEPFRAYETGAASGGGQTTSSGGGLNPTTGASSTWTTDANQGTVDFLYTSTVEGHQHGYASLGEHYHGMNHTHNVSIPSHAHSVSNHTHSIDYGIYESTAATGVKVYIDGTLRLDNGGSGYTTDQANLDVTQWITTAGWHTIELSSTRLGRINAAYFTQLYLIA